MTSPLKEYISPILLDRIPDFIKEDYPALVSLLREYFEWLEEDNNFLRVLLDFKSHRDVSSDSEDYINETLNQLGFQISRDIKISKSHLVYFLRNFYLSQGSLDSFKFLFKVFFDVDVDIQYPRIKMAVSSNSIFGGSTRIYTTANNSDQPKFIQIVNNKDAYFSTSIRGLQTNVITNIENIIQFEINGLKYLQVDIIPVDGHYLTDETLEFKYGDITFSESIVPVGKVTIINPGLNYYPGELITAYTDTDHQVLKGRYLITRTQRGPIDHINIDSSGTGYAVGDMIFTEYVSRGAGFSAEVVEVGGSGEITKVRILNKGWGYDRIPNTYIFSEAGTGGVISASSAEIGRVLQVDPVHPLVYKAPATVTTEIESTGVGAVIEVTPSDSFAEIRRNLYPINGVLGRNCVLTDSNLFQQFSYEIVSTVSLNEHVSISSAVHPVGYSRFNSLRIESKEDFIFDTAYTFSPTRVYNIGDDSTIVLPLLDWESLTLSNVISSDIGNRRQYSLSINILDEHKFSNSYDNLPTAYNYPIVDALNANTFMYEAMNAEIQIT